MNNDFKNIINVLLFQFWEKRSGSQIIKLLLDKLAQLRKSFLMSENQLIILKP
jgi:hypothetical protein